MPFTDAKALVDGILDALNVYHEKGIGHCDIKPDNSMIRNSSISGPVLIDFGLTYNIEQVGDDPTPKWQQIGNRFIALPEHQANSANKRDLRSDITCCVGILYYALTGIEPINLAVRVSVSFGGSDPQLG